MPLCELGPGNIGWGHFLLAFQEVAQVSDTEPTTSSPNVIINRRPTRAGKGPTAPVIIAECESGMAGACLRPITVSARSPCE
jgi:hypothetical protein